MVGHTGEGGRGVKDLTEDILGPESRKRSAVVAAPADAPPLLGMQGAHYATAIAEHFRDRGLHVLLLMDSLTRYALAQREIALAIGAPPATPGSPPRCLPRLPPPVHPSRHGPARPPTRPALHTPPTPRNPPQPTLPAPSTTSP